MKDMTLGDLQIGDIFYYKSKVGSAAAYYKVVGAKIRVRSNMMRSCKNLKTGKTLAKSCHAEVIKREPFSITK